MNRTFRTLFDILELLISCGESLAASQFLENEKMAFSDLSDQDIEWSLYRLASLALSNCEVALCSQILSYVPEAFHRDRAYRNLIQLQESFRSVEEGKCFFPLTVPVERRWKGPHVLPNINSEGKILTTWYAGRVDLKAFDRVSLIACEASHKNKPSKLMDFPISKFKEWCWGPMSEWLISEGQFVEIGVYDHDDKNPLIVLHPRRSLDFELPATPFNPYR